jgi:hypothetical protein
MVCLLLFKYRGSKDDPLSALLDAGPQEQRAQVLLDGAWADAEFSSDFFVAAARDQQFQNVLIAAGDFDLIEA